MHTFIDWSTMRSLAAEAGSYGAKETERALREISEQFQQRPPGPVELDVVSRLVDSSMLRREIEDATRDKLKRWYSTRTLSVLLLLVFVFLVLFLATLVYIFGWHLSPVLVSSGLIVGILLFFFWLLCTGRIQWSEYRAKLVTDQLILRMQRVTTRNLVLATLFQGSQSLGSEGTFRDVAYQLQNVVKQLANTNDALLDTMPRVV